MFGVAGAAAALVVLAAALPASGAVRPLPPTDPCVAAPTCVLVVVARDSYKSSSGDARVTSSPAGIDCRFVQGRPDGTSTCRSVFKSILPSVTMTLTATPDPGSVVEHGCASPSAVPCASSFTITGVCTTSDSCSEHFFRLRFVGFTLAVSKSGEGTGTVTSRPGIACGVTCTETGLANDTAVTLTATPDAGAVFKAWTGACAGQKEPCRLTISRDTSTNAVFGLPSPTTTTTKTTTVTTTTTSPPPPPPSPTLPPVTPPPPPPPVVTKASMPLAARLAGLRILTRGKARSLRVTVRVSTAARAQVQLLQQGFECAQELVRLHAGPNTVRLPLPASLGPGNYRLRVAVRAGARLATTSTLVTLETKGG